jgi:ABC-type multidrug transport system fused ATPase/permease subunit
MQGFRDEDEKRHDKTVLSVFANETKKELYNSKKTLFIYLLFLAVATWAQLAWYGQQDETSRQLKKKNDEFDIGSNLLWLTILWTLPKILLPIRRWALSDTIHNVAKSTISTCVNYMFVNGEEIVNDSARAGDSSRGLMAVRNAATSFIDTILTSAIPDIVALLFGMRKISVDIDDPITFGILSVVCGFSFFIDYLLACDDYHIKKINKIDEEISGAISISAPQIKTLILNNYQKKYIDEVVNELFSKIKIISANKTRIEMLMDIFKYLAISTGFLMVGYRSAMGTKPELFSWVIGMLNHVIWPMMRLSSSIPRILANTHTLQHNQFINKILVIPHKINHNVEGFRVKVEGVIEINFKNVKITYQPKNKIDNETGEGVKASPKTLQYASFTIKKGEKILLIGNNGAGKSTLIDLMTAIKIADTGTINIICRMRTGERVTLTPRNHKFEIRELIGVVSQDPKPVYGGKNRNLNLGVNADAKRSDFFTTDDDVPDLPELSGGQNQKLAIARLFRQEKPIMIFDEGTNALDEASRLRFEQELTAYKEKHPNCIVIRITHDVKEQMTLQNCGYRLISIDSNPLVDSKRDQTASARHFGSGSPVLRRRTGIARADLPLDPSSSGGVIVKPDNKNAKSKVGKTDIHVLFKMSATVTSPQPAALPLGQDSHKLQLDQKYPVVNLSDGRQVKIVGEHKVASDGNCGFRSILGNRYFRINPNLMTRKGVIEFLSSGLKDASIRRLISKDILAKYQEYVAGTWFMDQDRKFPEKLRSKFQELRRASAQNDSKDYQITHNRAIEAYCQERETIQLYLNDYLIRDEIWPHAQGSLAAFAQMLGIRIYCLQQEVHSGYRMLEIQQNLPDDEEEVFLVQNLERTHFERLEVSVLTELPKNLPQPKH